MLAAQSPHMSLSKPERAALVQAHRDRLQQFVTHAPLRDDVKGRILHFILTETKEYTNQICNFVTNTRVNTHLDNVAVAIANVKPEYGKVSDVSALIATLQWKALDVATSPFTSGGNRRANSAMKYFRAGLKICFKKSNDFPLLSLTEEVAFRLFENDYPSDNLCPPEISMFLLDSFPDLFELIKDLEPNAVYPLIQVDADMADGSQPKAWGSLFANSIVECMQMRGWCDASDQVRNEVVGATAIVNGASHHVKRQMNATSCVNAADACVLLATLEQHKWLGLVGDTSRRSGSLPKEIPSQPMFKSSARTSAIAFHRYGTRLTGGPITHFEGHHTFAKSNIVLANSYGGLIGALEANSTLQKAPIADREIDGRHEEDRRVHIKRRFHQSDDAEESNKGALQELGIALLLEQGETSWCCLPLGAIVHQDDCPRIELAARRLVARQGCEVDYEHRLSYVDSFAHLSAEQKLRMKAAATFSFVGTTPPSTTSTALLNNELGLAFISAAFEGLDEMRKRDLVMADWHPDNMLFSWQNALQHVDSPARWFMLTDFDRSGAIDDASSGACQSYTRRVLGEGLETSQDMFSLSVALFSLMNSGVMPPPDAFRDLNLSERSFTVWKTQEIDWPIDIQRALGIFAHWDDQWMDLVRDNEEDDDAAKRKLLGWLGFQASKAPTFGSMQDPGQLKRAIEMSNPKAHEVHPYSSASSPAS
eukprot:m.19362 g.19362  ORF g.19362 m.19362 type:complete len:708 (+) comp10895_c0_seq25:50-2173(+)